MRFKSNPLTVALAALLAITVTTPAVAGDGFWVEVDPILLQPMFVDVDTNSAKWEEYRDVSQDMTIPEIGLYGESADGNRTLGFNAENVLRDDARYTLSYGHSGSYALTVDYNVIPHRFVNGGSLPWSTRTSPDVFQIADPVQSQLQNAVIDRRASGGSVNFAFLENLTAPYFAVADTIDVGLARKRTAVRLDIAKLSSMSVGVELKHERRRGNRPYSGNFGFSNVLEIVEPIDYDTTSVEVGGEYRGDSAGLQFGYRFSSFENEYAAVTYDNPWRVTDSTSGRAYVGPNSSDDGPATGRNALSPDNTANMFYVNGRGKFGDGGWVKGSLGYNVMKQDENLLPHSTNSAIRSPFDVTDLANLPQATADTEAKALNFSVSAGAKLGEMARLSARYKIYDYDSNSAMLRFPGYVRMDAVWEDIPRQTVRYDYRRQNFEASVGFDLAPSTSLSVGYEREDWDRDFRETSNLHEDVLAIHLDHRAGGMFSLNGRYEYGKRSTDTYHTEAQEVTFTHPEGINNQPGLRKFNQAERSFHAARVQAQMMPSDQVDLAFGFNVRNEDYDKSEFGLTDDKAWELNGELNVAPQDDVNFFFFGNYIDREVIQRARQSGGTLSTREIDSWTATFDEKTYTLGVGFNAALSEGLKFDMSTNWTKADGDADFFSPPGGSPDVGVPYGGYDDSELLVLKAMLDWDFNDLVSAGVGYWFEDYETTRFGVDGIAPYVPGAVLLAGNDGKYQANVFTMNLNFHF